MEITTPALVTDLAAAFAGAGPVDRFLWALARKQSDAACGAETWAGRDRFGRTVAVAGLFPDGEQLEAWFKPGPLASRNMLGIVRAVRLTLAQHPYRGPIRAVLRSAAGVRIARLVGFRPTGETIDGLEVWEWASFSEAETVPPNVPRRRRGHRRRHRSAPISPS